MGACAFFLAAHKANGRQGRCRAQSATTPRYMLLCPVSPSLCPCFVRAIAVSSGFYVRGCVPFSVSVLVLKHQQNQQSQHGQHFHNCSSLPPSLSWLHTSAGPTPPCKWCHSPVPFLICLPCHPCLPGVCPVCTMSMASPPFQYFFPVSFGEGSLS